MKRRTRVPPSSRGLGEVQDALVGPLRHEKRKHCDKGPECVDIGAGDLTACASAEDECIPLTNQECPRALTRQARTLSSSAANTQGHVFVAASVPGVKSGSEWQPAQIVGERQTPAGVQYQVSGQGTVWIGKVCVARKLVRRYQAERRTQPKARTRCSSRL